MQLHIRFESENNGVNYSPAIMIEKYYNSLTIFAIFVHNSFNSLRCSRKRGNWKSIFRPENFFYSPWRFAPLVFSSMDRRSVKRKLFERVFRLLGNRSNESSAEEIAIIFGRRSTSGSLLCPISFILFLHRALRKQQ